MRRLTSAIKAALPDAIGLGGGRNIDRDLFVEALGDLAAHLGRAYRLRATTALLVLCLLCVAVLRYADQPNLLLPAMAGLAITLVGALAALQQVSNEIARVNLIRAIAHEIDLEALTEVARRLVTAS